MADRNITATTTTHHATTDDKNNSKQKIQVGKEYFMESNGTTDSFTEYRGIKKSRDER